MITYGQSCWMSFEIDENGQIEEVVEDWLMYDDLGGDRQQSC
jgi:hypothetical protein